MSGRAGKVVCDLTVSLDGYAAGPGQSDERPFGDDGGDGSGATLHAWMFEDADENRAEIDLLGSARAFVMGRNMLGPVRARGTGRGTAGGATNRRSTPRCSC